MPCATRLGSTDRSLCYLGGGWRWSVTLCVERKGQVRQVSAAVRRGDDPVSQRREQAQGGEEPRRGATSFFLALSLVWRARPGDFPNSIPFAPLVLILLFVICYSLQEEKEVAEAKKELEKVTEEVTAVLEVINKKTEMFLFERVPLFFSFFPSFVLLSLSPSRSSPPHINRCVCVCVWFA